MGFVPVGGSGAEESGNYNERYPNHRTGKIVKRKHVHTEAIAIRWGDMDAMGYVNNTIYFRYMEQARISWFDAQGRSVPLPDRIRQIIDG